MPKGYQILMKHLGLWKPPAVPTQETQVFNPLKAKIGSSVTLDLLDYRQLNFFVRAIKEYNCRKLQFVDYVLVARPFDREDVVVRLRLSPSVDPQAELTHNVLLLSLYHEQAYDEELVKVLTDQSKKFVVDDTKNDDDPTNDTHEEYFRVNDVGESHVAAIKTLVDTNNDGKVDANEVTKEKIEFWDYSRNAVIEGNKKEQYLFVEKDEKTGWFQMWQGVSVNPERIEVA